MPRLQLFEFNDQPWLPSVLRDAMTGYLEAISRVFGMDQAMLPLVRELLERSGATQLVDLCSGGTGPLLALRKELPGDVCIVLTDLFPNQTALQDAARVTGVEVRLDPVDATAVPAELVGARTIFNALHHFPQPVARALVEDAWRSRSPFLAVELSDRTVANLLTSPLIPVFTWIFMPRVRPFRWSYALFTYVIPVMPLLIWWDGVVSHLRVYSEPELRALTAGLDDGYRWEVRHVAAMPGARLTVLMGLPVAPVADR